MRPRFMHPSPSRSSRAGFTLVEVLIAIFLIEIGLLALTASSAVVVRETMIVRARTTALETARNRIETTAASRCAASSGILSANGFGEDWSARLVPVSTRAIRDSVTFTVQRVTRVVLLETRTPCTP